MIIDTKNSLNTILTNCKFVISIHSMKIHCHISISIFNYLFWGLLLILLELFLGLASFTIAPKSCLESSVWTTVFLRVAEKLWIQCWGGHYLVPPHWLLCKLVTPKFSSESLFTWIQDIWRETLSSLLLKYTNVLVKN